MFSFPRKQPNGTAVSPTQQAGVPPSHPGSNASSSERTSPTARKTNNNDKVRKLSIQIGSAFHRSSSLNGAIESPSHSTKVDPALEHEEEDDTVEHRPTTTLKSVRSMYVDQRHPPRKGARDFSLHPPKPSPLVHEDCTSLRDQFLKIKERFSVGGASPTATASVTSSNTSTPSSASTTGTVVVSVDTDAAATRIEAEAASPPPASLSAPTIPTSPVDNEEEKQQYVQNSIRDHERLLADLDALNEEAKQNFPADLLWPQHAHLERWFIEDNYLKGSVTCWSIERGADVVSSIASVVARSSSTLRINPDISLQWIGRQLWGVTVLLPLTLSAELKPEHLALARLIDQAVIDQIKCSASAIRPPMNVDDGDDASAHTIACWSINNQFPTIQATSAMMMRSGDSDAIPSATGGTTSAVVPDASAIPGGGRDSQTSDDGLLADKHGAEDGETHDDISSKSVTLHEDDERLHAAVAPFQWTKLSFSSISSTPLNPDGGATLDEDSSQRFAPDKTGWLKKKAGLNSWQARYYELKGNRLYYFTSETDGVPRGVIVLDHAHVLRGTGENSMSFTITTSSSTHALQIIKFTGRTTYQTHARKSCVLRVVEDSDENVCSWVTALNRASFYCNLTGTPTSASSSQSFASPGKKKKLPFYRLRSPSSSNSSAEDDAKGVAAGTTTTTTVDCAQFHHYGSVKYLQETDPLLWEIHPHDQIGIRKKATLARTKSDYLHILSKYNVTFRQIFLPRPRPISIEQTLRDILPELFLINNILYGGGEENNGLENIFEVLDSYVKRFATAHEERVRAVSTLLQACARTISGGDSYFVVYSLLGNSSMIIRPAEARGHPIEIEVSPSNPCQFSITVFSAFSFHHIDDVERYGDDSADTTSGSAISCTPEPLVRLHTYHVQEFDFGSGKSSRWLRVRADGMKEDDSHRNSWMKREGSESGYGALLDALSQ
ncbi:TPA: hypothetical protein N0F65_003587 [Lagenidium giganteum]|uniref:PH domain-containing protein n=1 Tax=Lagenidium giganteum TaxID=4803 RepID=A0AAV2YZZ3_9STRA|nr:TPA: hypothetical protein N0F65_003587 [Lagenidium giganteum]